MALFEIPQAGTGAGVFGVDAEPAKPVFGLGTYGGTSAVMADYGNTTLGQFMQQKQQEMMMAAGVTGVDWADFDQNNPLEDPETQRAANETALAKLATANPELAQSIAANMQNKPDETKSLWDNIKEVVAPVMSVGAKGLELLSRPMHLVPELISDDENDTWYEDVGQVLSGNSTATWSEVLDEEMGVENKLVRAIGGFAMDVLTDPLTYAGFGMLGMGRRVAQSTASSTVFRGVIQKGLKGAPTEVQERAIAELTNRFTFLARQAPEASAAQLAKYIDDIPGITNELRDEAIRAAHETAQVMGRGQASRVLPRGSVLNDAGEEVAWDAKLILQRTAAQRVGREARAAAGALGGVRIKGGIPFMNYRYSFTSGALPFTEGRKFLGLGGNFFRGTSGMTRLQNFLNKNPAISPAERELMYTTWTQQGFKGFSKLFPEYAKELGNGAMNFGSMFYEASSRVGRVTASLSPRSNAYRHGGLVGVAAANATRSAQALESKLNDAAYELFAEVDDITGEALPAVNKVDFEKSARQVLEDKDQSKYLEWLSVIDNPSILKLSDEEITEHLTADAARVRLNRESSVEARVAEGILSEAQATRELTEIAAKYQDEVTKAEAKIKRMRNADSLIPEDKKPHLYNFRRGMRQVMEYGDLHGNKVGDRSTTLAFADVVNPNDVPRFTATGNQMVAKADTYAVLQGAGPRVADAGDTGYGLRGIEWNVGDDQAKLARLKQEQADLQARQAREQQDKLKIDDSRMQELTTEIMQVELAIKKAAKASKTPEMKAGTVFEGPDGIKYKAIGDSKQGAVPAVMHPGSHHSPEHWIDLKEVPGMVPKEKPAIPETWVTDDRTINMLGTEELARFKSSKGDLEYVSKPLREKIAKEGITEPIQLSVDAEGRAVIVDGHHRLAVARDLGIESVPVRIHKTSSKNKPEWGGAPAIAENTGSRRVAVRAENPLIIRDGVLSDAPILKKWESELKGLFDNPEIRKTFIAENKKYLDDAEWAKFVASETQLHMSRRALDAGYDSVVQVRTVDGVEQVVGGVTLVDPKMKRGIGMASIDDEVGQIYGGRGYVPHIASDELLKSAYGERHARQTQDIRMGEFVHEKERLSDESIFELNDRLKAKYGLRGNAVKMDLGEIYNLYAQRTARGAAQRQLGIAAESLHALYGRVAPEMVTSLNRYAGKGFLDHGAVVKLSEGAAKHYDSWTSRQERLIAKQEKVAEEAVAELRRIRAASYGEGMSRPAVAVRQLGGKRVAQGVGLGRKTTELQKKILKLKLALKNEKHPLKQLELQEQIDEIQATLNEARVATRQAKSGKIGEGTPEKVVQAAEKQSDALQAEAQRWGKLTVAQQRKLEAAEMAVEKANQELAKLRHRFETHAAKATPAFTTDSTKAGYDAITGIPEMQGLYAHPYIAEEFANALVGKGLTDARKEWRRFQGIWKSWATVYYPGFHVRNNMGAWFNNRLGGVTSGHYAYSLRISNALKGGKYADVKLGRELGQRFGVDPNTTWRQLGETFHSMGVRSSNSMALIDQQDAVGAIRRWQSGKLSRAEKISAGAGRSRPARWARKGTEVTENFHRQAAMLRGLEATGGDWAGARAFTMMRHGDYEDLNDFEHFIKDVIPFYKWMRMNLPFQLHQLIESPGKHLAVMKATDASIVAAGEDPEEIRRKLPKSALEAFNIALPRGVDGDEALQLISLDLPMADLYQGAADFLSSFTPLVTPMVESYVIKKNLYSGAPLTGKRVPMAGWMQLPGIKQLLSPFTELDANGNEVMSDQTQKILNIIPVFSRFRPWAFADEKSTNRRVAALASAFFGVRPEDFNDEDLLSYEKAFYYENIEPEIANLRNLGVSLPEPDMISPSVFNTLGFAAPQEETTETAAPSF